MIPTRRMIIGAAILVVLALSLSVYGCQQWQRARTAATQAKLATGQAGAALESGKDAVETVGNASAREGAITETVKEGTDAIRAAPAGDSNAAAERAACRLRSYRNQPRCVALLGPAPK